MGRGLPIWAAEETEGQLSCMPASLRDDSRAGLGNSVPEGAANRSASSQPGLGPWTVKGVPWDLALSYQDRE